MTSAEKAELLHRLHHDPDILVLVNVWDVASARTIATLPGCRAIATASWSIAASLGVPDHERLTRDRMLAVAGRIAGAVDLPVTADLESGYGTTASDVGETVARAIGLGIVGCNLEDRQRPLVEAAARVGGGQGESGQRRRRLRRQRPARHADQHDGGDRRGRHPRTRLPRRRGGLHLPHHDPRRRRPRRVRPPRAAPVNAFGIPGGPAVADLAALGVARVSFGPGPQGAALAALRRAGETLLAGGPVDADLAFRPPVRQG
jgi:2-methylisocitrate lyase-like PEP mutase family enzyme